MVILYLVRGGVCGVLHNAQFAHALNGVQTVRWLVIYTWCVEEFVVYCASAHELNGVPHYCTSWMVLYTWCEEEFVVYYACAEWCPILIAGWLYHTWCVEESVVYCAVRMR